VQGLEADCQRIDSLIQCSLGLATGLAPSVGYDRATEIAKLAHISGRTVREVAEEQGILTEEELDRALDIKRQTEPG